MMMDDEIVRDDGLCWSHPDIVESNLPLWDQTARGLGVRSRGWLQPCGGVLIRRCQRQHVEEDTLRVPIAGHDDRVGMMTSAYQDLSVQLRADLKRVMG